MLTVISAGDYGYTAIDDNGQEWGQASTAKRALAIAAAKIKKIKPAPEPDTRPADVPLKFWNVCDFGGTK